MKYSIFLIISFLYLAFPQVSKSTSTGFKDLNNNSLSLDVDSFRKVCFSRMSEEENLSNIINDCSIVLEQFDLENWPRARVLMLRGFFYSRKNFLTSAYYDFKTALGLIDKQEKYSKSLVYCAGEAGKYAGILGCFEQASIFFETALLYAHEADSSRVLNDYGLVRKAQGKNTEALRLWNLALRVNQDPTFDFTVIGNKIDLFIERSQLDSVQYLLQNNQKNGIYLSEWDELYLDLYTAQYATLLQKPRLAIEQYLELIQEAKRLNLFQDFELPITLDLVKCNWKLEDYDNNINLLKQLIEKYKNERSVEELPPNLLEVYSWYLKNLLMQNVSNKEEFDKSIDQILDLVKHFQQNFLFNQEKTYLAIYLKEILETSYAYYTQKGKGLEGEPLKNLVLLNESVRAIQLKERMIINQSGEWNELLPKKQKEIDEALLKLESQGLDVESKLEWNLKLDKLRQELLTINDSLNPSNASFLRDSSVSLYDHDSTEYLLYFVGQEAVYSLLISNGYGKTSRINISPKELDSLSTKLYSYIVGKKEEYYPLSFKLFQLLWPKSILSKSKRVVVLADKMLYKIPFEALVIDTMLPRHFLLNKYSISYSYTLLQTMQDGTTLLDQNTFIHHSFHSDQHFAYVSPDKNPAELLDGYKVEFREGSLHAKAQFLKALKQNDLVHLTTHGSFNGLDAKLYFDNGDSLEMTELYKQRNKAKLVMLNACWSGLGRKNEIEGTIHFAYPILYGGCANVSVNLWESNPDISQNITGHFFSKLKDVQLTTALREAKLAFLRDEETTLEMQHPYYWASLVIYSQSMAKATLAKKSSFGWLIFLAVTTIAITVLGYQKFNRMHRSKIANQ
jgi:CHAT domain-containing protein